jgi:DNA repair protein RecO (recombination protein O)
MSGRRADNRRGLSLLVLTREGEPARKRMPLKESEAIVLRTFPLGEGDRLVSFLDRQSGKLRGVARGAKLPKSRFGSTLELLSYIRIWYFERETRELVRINQCELIESFLDLQRDYQAGVYLALMSEITEAVLGDREAADPQFRLLLLSARAIRTNGPTPAILAYFCLWTVRLGGWLGSLDQCARCGRALGQETVYASPGSSGMFCAECREDGRGLYLEPAGARMKSISQVALSVGRAALSGTLERLLKGNPSLPGSNEISSFALDILEHHIERKLVARQMLVTGKSE